MESSIVKITKVIQGDKTFYNIYLFDTAIKVVNKNDFSKLYYSVRTYCNLNNIEVKEYVKEVKNTNANAKK